MHNNNDDSQEEAMKAQSSNTDPHSAPWALITGASSGLGAIFSRIAAESGLVPVIVARREDALRSVAEQIRTATGCEAIVRAADLSDPQSVYRLADDLLSERGTPAVLVNNAGTQSVDKMMHEITAEEWSKNFGVDINGVFYCNKHCVRDMLKRGKGSIVNISSVQGLAGSYAELNFPYHACKAAVCGMTKQDACLYGPLGIRFNSVCPSAIDTPMVRGRLQPESVFNEYMAKEAKAYPLRKIGDVDDVAYAALYLASDEAKFVTGVNLPVDGGYLAY